MAGFGQFRDFTAMSLALRGTWTEELVMNSPLAVLFNEQTSNDAQEITQGFEPSGLVPIYNGTIDYGDGPDVGDRRTFIHDQLAKGLAIPRLLIDTGKYGIVQTMVRSNADAFSDTIAYEMASVYNNAFSTSVTVNGVTRNYAAADGKALCASTRNSGKAVLNNAGTLPLTHDNLATTRRLMRAMKNRYGLVIRSNPDTLVVGIGLEDKASEIVKSMLRSDTANNTANTVNTISLIVDPLLSDSNNWFMVDSRKAKRHLWWWWLTKPEYKVHPASDYDLEFKTRGYMAYSFGADNATWIYGHNVA
jgi:hypothetical protein